MKYLHSKIKTVAALVLVCLGLLNLQACATNKIKKTPETVEEAEKELAKNREKEAKLNQKEAEAAKKRHWDLQSKAAKKSVKMNEKRMKKNKKRGVFMP